MKQVINNKNIGYCKFLTSVLAATLNGLVWAVALWMVLSGTEWGRVGGWLLLGGKGAMLLTTGVGLLVHPTLAWRLFAGRYRFANQTLRGVVQALTRFVWELPQTGLGYLFAQWRNILGKVERVDTLDGVTFATGRHWKKHTYAGVSLGCFVNMWVNDRIGDDFEGYARCSPFHIFGHEYGHTVDSQLWGWLYLPVVGLSSVVSQLLDLDKRVRHNHDKFWVERRADRFGKRFFE